MMLLGFIACSKKGDAGSNQQSESAAFTISEVETKREVAKDESTFIEFSVNRPQTYKGRYTITYEQQPYHGLGTVTYRGAKVVPNVSKNLVSDNILLSYTAATENYHLLSFTITDEDNRKVYFKVEYNSDKEGVSDELFDVSVTEYQPTISKNESVSISMELRGFYTRAATSLSTYKSRAMESVSYS